MALKGAFDILTATDWNDLYNASAARDADVAALKKPPAVELRRVAVQSITSGGAAQSIQWDAEDFDNDGMFAIGTPTDIVCKTAGYYDLIAGGVINGASNLKIWEAYKNGTVQRAGAATGPDTVSQNGRTNLVITLKLLVADIVTVRVFQLSGGTQDCQAWMSMRKRSDL